MPISVSGFLIILLTKYEQVFIMTDNHFIRNDIDIIRSHLAKHDELLFFNQNLYKFLHHLNPVR
jgi:hypothetical protein